MGKQRGGAGLLGDVKKKAKANLASGEHFYGSDEEKFKLTADYEGIKPEESRKLNELRKKYEKEAEKLEKLKGTIRGADMQQYQAMLDPAMKELNEAKQELDTYTDKINLSNRDSPQNRNKRRSDKFRSVFRSRLTNKTASEEKIPEESNLPEGTGTNLDDSSEVDDKRKRVKDLPREIDEMVTKKMKVVEQTTRELDQFVEEATVKATELEQLKESGEELSDKVFSETVDKIGESGKKIKELGEKMINLQDVVSEGGR